jgi:hypothetical protein
MNQIEPVDRVNEIISRITMGLLGNESFRFIVEKDKRGGNRIYIQVEYSSPCTKDGDIKTWKGRKWYLSEYMLDNEIVFTAYTAYKMCVEHEIMESFKIDGIILVNPHVEYTKLLEISHNEVSRDSRNS